MGRRAHVRLDDPLAPPRARLRRAHRLFRSHDPRRSWKRPAQANSSRIGVFKRTLRPSGSGQIKSELSKRLKVSRTVERANPRRRAISLVVSEDKYLRRMITRTSRMATLSAGIGAPLVAQRSDLKSGQRRDAHPGGIIPLQVAQSSRYEWRHHLVKGGGFRRNQHSHETNSTDGRV